MPLVLSGVVVLLAAAVSAAGFGLSLPGLPLVLSGVVGLLGAASVSAAGFSGVSFCFLPGVALVLSGVVALLGAAFSVAGFSGVSRLFLPGVALLSGVVVLLSAALVAGFSGLSPSCLSGVGFGVVLGLGLWLAGSGLGILNLGLLLCFRGAAALSWVVGGGSRLPLNTCTVFAC